MTLLYGSCIHRTPDAPREGDLAFAESWRLSPFLAELETDRVEVGLGPLEKVVVAEQAALAKQVLDALEKLVLAQHDELAWVGNRLVMHGSLFLVD
jgi:hypothetical protein